MSALRPILLLGAMSPFFSLLIFTVAAVGSYLYRKQLMSQTEATWRQAASLTDGSFRPSNGAFWRPTSAFIDATIESVEVQVDHYTVSHGRSSTTYTRITAPTWVPSGLSLKIYAEGFFSSVGKAIGAQDVEVGDRAFDDAFIVKASDEGLARIWIDRAFRELSLGLREYTVTLEGGRVTSVRTGLESDADQLASAMRQVALLASRGRRLLDRWRALAKRLSGDVYMKGLSWPGDQRAAIRAEHKGVLITVAIVMSAASPRSTNVDTKVSAPQAASPGERFSIRRRSPGESPGVDPFHDAAFIDAYVLEAADPAKAFRRFSDDVRARILALGPEAITASESDLSLVLKGVAVTAKKIEPAMAIVAELASARSEGPYR